MIHIIFNSFARQIKQNKSMAVILFIGVIISIYCVSVMQGLAVGQYHLYTGRNSYATITVDPGKDITAALNEFSLDVSTISDKGVANVLYITPQSEDHVLIGWDGVTAKKWFPITSGRFFDESEQSEGAFVAFISDNLQEKILPRGHIDIGNLEYKIIGTGWIVPANFITAISSESNMNIIQAKDKNTSQYFSIIPFSRYKEEFVPKQILIHFKSATNAQLESYAVHLSEKYPTSKFYLPDKNSDNLLVSNQVKYGILGMLLSLIAGTTVLQLIREWIGIYQKELQVYYICGLNRTKCIFLIYTHWFFMFCIGIIIAVLLHYVSFPLLEKVYANYLPSWPILCFTLIGLFLISVAYSYSSIFDVFNASAGEEFM